MEMLKNNLAMLNKVKKKGSGPWETYTSYYPCLFTICVWYKLVNLSFLKEKKRLSVPLDHIAEAFEQQKQVVLKFRWSNGRYECLQSLWVVVVHWDWAISYARISTLILQDPIIVDDKFWELRVKCLLVPKIIQLLHEVNIPLSEVSLIAFICLPCQRICANLQERKRSLWVSSASRSETGMLCFSKFLFFEFRLKLCWDLMSYL